MRRDKRSRASCKPIQVLGLVLLVGGTASGQFASDRLPSGKAPTPLPGGLTPVGQPAPVVGGYQPLTPPTPPATPNGSQYTPTYPIGQGAYVPPVDAPRPQGSAGSVPGAVPSLATLPLNVEIPTALPKDHPWALRPEHGAYFIIVKSYVRPSVGSKGAKEEGAKWVSALAMAEGLAREIREVYNSQALLYEYISEERKAEMRAYLIAREKAKTEYEAQVRAIEQKAQLQGYTFETPDNKLRMRMHDHQDQIGVLVGGYATEEDAKKGLAKLKTWPMPKNTALLDRGLYTTSNKLDGKVLANVSAFVNPYETAFIVPNPAITRATQPQEGRGLDPFLIRLNEGTPFNLLKATKGWTLGVKSFTAPVELNKDSEKSLARKWLPGKSSEVRGADVLAAGAEQAESLAKALRSLKGPRGESLNLEAFVLHTRTASIVTVGQFDAPDDPALLATKRLLSGMGARVSEDQVGMRPVTNTPSLFDKMMPIPIPRH